MYLLATNLGTLYSSVVAARTLDDGRLVEMLYHPQRGVFLRIDGEGWDATGLSDTNGPRLNADGWLYVSQGNAILRQPVASSNVEIVKTFPGSVTIGGNQGDFDPTGTLLPINVFADEAGVLNVETGDWWTVPVGSRIDALQVADADTVVVVAGRTLRVSRDGTIDVWAQRQGHDAMGTLANGHPFYVMTTSNWASVVDFDRWMPQVQDPTSFNAMIVVDVVTQEPVYIAEIGWFDHHFAAVGTRIVVSHTGETAGPGWIEVHDIESGIIYPRTTTGVSASNYEQQTKAAFNDAGTRIYYTRLDDTWIIDLDAPEPVPPIPEPTPEPVPPAGTPRPWQKRGPNAKGKYRVVGPKGSANDPAKPRRRRLVCGNVGNEADADAIVGGG